MAVGAFQPDLVTYLDTLFQPKEIVNYYLYSEEGKPKGRGYFETVEKVRHTVLNGGIDALGKYNYSVGCWIRVNPMDGLGICDKNVIAYRHALIESDHGSIENQERIIRELNLPVAALVYSGNKSVHAICRVDARDAAEYDTRVAQLYAVCRRAGLDVDEANKNPSRLSRLPGAIRGDKVQRLIGVNIGAATWAEWVAEQGLPALDVTDWPDPKPVVSVSSVVSPVLQKMLPESISPWVFDAADRMQAPVDYVAVSAIISMGSLVGRQLCIRPKARDSWAVVPNIWATLVGPPAAMKSPCLKEARRFLDKLDREAQAEYDAAIKEYSREYITYETWDKALKTKAGRAKTKEEQARILEEMEEPPEPPIRVRKYTQDTTVEKLQDLLTKNPTGMLMLRDELVGFLRSLDKPGQESARAFILECWEGNGRFLIDRIMRGSTCIDGACLAVLGGTTPGGVSEYVVDAMGNGTGNDGLLQRFSLVAYPDITPDFTYTDRAPDDQAAALAEKAFNRCYSINTDSIGADCYPDSLPFLRYNRTAQSYFEDWYTDLMVRCRRGDEHPALLSHLNKFTKLVPAVSLIFHVCNGETGPVGPGPLLQAITWAEYAESHARKLYESAFHDAALNGATVLLRHIEQGDLNVGFSSRDVGRKCWTGLTSQEQVTVALEELLDAGYIRRHKEKKPVGGPATFRYDIHPKYRRDTHEQVG